MENGHASKRALFQKLDSTVLLERHDESPTSSQVYMRQKTGGPHTPDVEQGTGGATPVGIELSIRFGRVIALMILTVAALVAVTLWLQQGVTLKHYNPAGMSTAAQAKLVDDYNSYTGNVASIFGKPLEIFVALAVQVVVLRLLTASLLSTEVGWKADAFTLALTAGVGYLLANGLNSLNVQPQQPEITALISAADLKYTPQNSTSDSALRSSNLSQTFSERSSKNPITNTALRNLVLPRVPISKSECEPINRIDASYTLPDVVLEFGLPQRDWQSRLLQEALEPKQLRVVVNPSNKTAKQSMDLPMQASVAAELYVHSMLISPFYLPWARLPTLVSEKNVTGKVESVARVAGLLSPSVSDETAQRDRFIRESAKSMSQQMSNTQNLVKSDITMEFSRVDISPTMRFDALTIDFEVDPTLIASTRSKDNSTLFNSLALNWMCGPWPLRCAMPNPAMGVLKAEYDTPAQVQVFGTCVNDDGAEELSLEAKETMSWGIYKYLRCAGSSNSSLMVATVAKRFVASSVVQNKSVNSSGIFDSPGSAYVSNLRRIYSITIAKLSWELADLKTEFNAGCAADAGSCKGLRFPLDPAPGNTEQQQELIVGADALPTSVLTPLVFAPSISTGTRFVPLVQVLEPTPPESLTQGTALGIDPLLPHNGGKISWDMQAPRQYSCDLLVEDRIQLVLNNHMYIEHGLQTAYTAATFYILQSGVVKDVIKLDKTRTTLNFEQNEQLIALKASIPIQNAWLTLGGCAVLVIGLCSVMLWACVKSSAGKGYSELGQVTTPHVVARVMLDPARYPPAVLNRRVIGEGTETTKPPSVDGFLIDGLGLQPPPEKQ